MDRSQKCGRLLKIPLVKSNVPNKVKHCLQAFSAERHKSQLNSSKAVPGNREYVLKVDFENRIFRRIQFIVEMFKRYSLLQSLAVQSP